MHTIQRYGHYVIQSVYFCASFELSRVCYLLECHIRSPPMTNVYLKKKKSSIVTFIVRERCKKKEEGTRMKIRDRSVRLNWNLFSSQRVCCDLRQKGCFWIATSEVLVSEDGLIPTEDSLDDLLVLKNSVCPHNYWGQPDTLRGQQG